MFTLACIFKHTLDGIDNAGKVRIFIKHTLSLGIRVKTSLIDREYSDSDVMNTVDSRGLNYIISAKYNNKGNTY